MKKKKSNSTGISFKKNNVPWWEEFRGFLKEPWTLSVNSNCFGTNSKSGILPRKKKISWKEVVEGDYSLIKDCIPLITTEKVAEIISAAFSEDNQKSAPKVVHKKILEEFIRKEMY